MPSLNPDDPALLARVAKGDREAFRSLFEAHQVPLFRYLVRILKDEAMARDATNEAFIEVWKNAGRFQGRSKPKTWIFGIAHNKAVDLLRKKREMSWDEDAAAEIPDDGPDPFEQTAEADTSRLILGLLEELSPEHRAVIQLTYYDGLSIKEIADVTDCPEATVKTRMFYARKRLKTLLTEAGVKGAQV